MSDVLTRLGFPQDGPFVRAAPQGDTEVTYEWVTPQRAADEGVQVYGSPNPPPDPNYSQVLRPAKKAKRGLAAKLGLGGSTDERLDELSGQLGELINAVRGLEQRVTIPEQRFQRLEEGIEVLTERVEENTQALEALGEEVIGILMPDHDIEIEQDLQTNIT